MNAEADPAAAGVCAERLGRLVASFERLVEARRLPGAVLHVERHGRVALHEAIGMLDPATRAPMRSDAIFRIASMTKPVVSVAALRLFEAGRLRLDEPVARYLPAFAGAKVLVEREGGEALVDPQRPMLVHDLLRHTAGLTYEFQPPSAAGRRYIDAEVASPDRSSAEQVAILAGLPLKHAPGSCFEYSRATDVLGHLVEVVADASLGDHLQRTLFDPLAMTDTGFDVPRAKHDRIAEAFAESPDGEGTIRAMEVRRPPRRQSGGGGLVSTAPDYARFARMLLRGGNTDDGVRILGRKTVEWMTSDHLGTIPVADSLLPPGHGFGLGVAVRLADGIAHLPGSAGTYGWGGSAGTVAFVDPRERLVGVAMLQAPAQREEFQQLFRNGVHAAVD